uniref:Uncharacterized protein n=1 Tax=Knipowitschia caucasica TaxID=637954 RepID=A0AAV2LQN3_KNICA
MASNWRKTAANVSLCSVRKRSMCKNIELSPICCVAADCGSEGRRTQSAPGNSTKFHRLKGRPEEVQGYKHEEEPLSEWSLPQRQSEPARSTPGGRLSPELRETQSNPLTDLEERPHLKPESSEDR